MTPVVLSVLLAVAPAAVRPALDLPTAEPSSVGLSARRLERIDDDFRALVEEKQIAGALTLVSRRGQIAHVQAHGWRDVEARGPMELDAIFRIASMTKAVTAVAVLQLLERGRFRLDDPVSTLIPAFGGMKVMDADQTGADPGTPRVVGLARPITIRDLLRHTSGLLYGGEGYKKAGLGEWQGSLAAFVERLLSLPLAFQPGTRFRYSYSTDVLGHLVEIVSGQPLDRYFEESIFTPLDMRDTGFVVPAEKISRLTNHYEMENGQLVCKEHAETSPFRARAEGLSGGGGWRYSYPGLVTTARDWWRFLEMLRNHGRFGGRRVLGRKSVELMVADHLGDIPGRFEPGTGHGLGVGVVTDGAKHGQLASTGTIFWAGSPHNTYYFVDFKEEMCGILMVQTGPSGHQGMMGRFLTLASQAIDD